MFCSRQSHSVLAAHALILLGDIFSQPELLRLQSPTIRNWRAWNKFGEHEGHQKDIKYALYTWNCQKTSQELRKLPYLQVTWQDEFKCQLILDVLQLRCSLFLQQRPPNKMFTAFLLRIFMAC